jgi:hypothetical protein
MNHNLVETARRAVRRVKASEPGRFDGLKVPSLSRDGRALPFEI